MWWYARSIVLMANQHPFTSNASNSVELPSAAAVRGLACSSVALKGGNSPGWAKNHCSSNSGSIVARSPVKVGAAAFSDALEMGGRGCEVVNVTTSAICVGASGVHWSANLHDLEVTPHPTVGGCLSVAATA